jgi:hypothetical protein
LPRDAGLCTDGHTDATGRLSLLLGALMASCYRVELRYRRSPDAVQRLVCPALAAAARHRGLERTVDGYLGLDAHPSAQVALGRLPESVMSRHGSRA